MNVLVEHVFDAGRVEKVVFGLFDDVGRVDEKQEIAIALLIEVENQPSHDERLAAARRHVEEQVQGIGSIGKVVFLAMEKARKGIHLIRTQLVGRIRVLRDAIGDFLFDTFPLRMRIELFL